MVVVWRDGPELDLSLLDLARQDHPGPVEDPGGEQISVLPKQPEAEVPDVHGRRVSDVVVEEPGRAVVETLEADKVDEHLLGPPSGALAAHHGTVGGQRQGGHLGQVALLRFGGRRRRSGRGGRGAGAGGGSVFLVRLLRLLLGLDFAVGGLCLLALTQHGQDLSAAAAAGAGRGAAGGRGGGGLRVGHLDKVVVAVEQDKDSKVGCSGEERKSKMCASVLPKVK